MELSDEEFERRVNEEAATLRPLPKQIWSKLPVLEQWAYFRFYRSRPQAPPRNDPYRFIRHWQERLTDHQRNLHIVAAIQNPPPSYLNVPADDEDIGDFQRPGPLLPEPSSPLPRTYGWHNQWFPFVVDQIPNIDYPESIPPHAMGNLKWVFKEQLYSRGYPVDRSSKRPKGFWTTVRLYLGLDRQDRMRSRVVVKDVSYLESYRGVEADLNELEVAQENCLALPDSEYILKPWLGKRHEFSYQERDANGNVITKSLKRKGRNIVVASRKRRKGWKSYSDYCEGGDLDKIIHRHEQKRQTPNPPTIPEGFIWHAFMNAAEALYIVGRNRPFPTPTPREDGNEEENEVELEEIDIPGHMIHRDIKPGNLFVRRSKNPDDPYPIVILADFDQSIKGDDFAKHPEPWGGTDGYRAPEYYDTNMNESKGIRIEDLQEAEEHQYEGTLNDNFDYGAAEDYEVLRITYKADVWSLAGAIWDLMNAKRPRNSPPPPNMLGLRELRTELHARMMSKRWIAEGYPLEPRDRPPLHAEEDQPTHDIMETFNFNYQERLLRLPKYTSWLIDIRQRASMHHPARRLTVVQLLKELRQGVKNFKLVGAPFTNHGGLMPSDDLYRHGRIVRIIRRPPAPNPPAPNQPAPNPPAPN